MAITLGLDSAHMPTRGVTRHYDVEIIPAFDAEGEGTIHVTSKQGRLSGLVRGVDNPEQVGAKIGQLIRVLERGGMPGGMRGRVDDPPT